MIQTRLLPILLLALTLLTPAATADHEMGCTDGGDIGGFCHTHRASDDDFEGNCDNDYRHSETDTYHARVGPDDDRAGYAYLKLYNLCMNNAVTECNHDSAELFVGQQGVEGLVSSTFVKVTGYESNCFQPNSCGVRIWILETNTQEVILWDFVKVPCPDTL